MGGATSYFSGPPRPARNMLKSQGNNDYGQAGPDGSPLAQAEYIASVAAGTHHSMAVTTLGEVFVWGCNMFGQLGDGQINSEDRRDAITLPVAISIREMHVSVKIRSVAAGWGHSAAVSDSGQLYTWGLGSEGQLCYECTVSNSFVIPFTKERCQLTPKRVDEFRNDPVSAVACGKDFTLILTAKKRLYAAGSGKWGVLGNGKICNQSVPSPVIFEGVEDCKVGRVACGWSHCLAAVKKVGVFMWGRPYLDIDDDQPTVRLPELVLSLQPMDDVVSLAGGQNHSAAVVLSMGVRSALFTWGSNAYQQLGYPTDDLSLQPRAVDAVADVDIHSVTCGWNYTAAVVSDGKVMGWGGNKYYQFGEEREELEPSILPIEQQVDDVVSGYSHLLILTVPTTVHHSERRLASTAWSTDKMFMEDFFPKHED